MKKFSTWLKQNEDITKHYYLMQKIFGGYKKDLDILVRDYILQEYSPITGKKHNGGNNNE